MRYSLTRRSALNMLFICVSIVVTATAAFLCNKKQNGKEQRQSQNVGMLTPMTSPSSCFHNVDKELDILSSQPFVQTTKIHLGERPNLKSKLFIFNNDLEQHKNPHIHSTSQMDSFCPNFWWSYVTFKPYSGIIALSCTWLPTSYLPTASWINH